MSTISTPTCQMSSAVQKLFQNNTYLCMMYALKFSVNGK